MMTISKRLDDLTDAIKNKRTRDDKVKFIRLIMPDYIETWNIETHERKRVYKDDEQGEQTS